MAEIMAPAGNMEQLEAAVRSGAHRVYFGCGQLNARRNAKGFNSPEEVIEYCHARGVKATAALNIVLKDSELETACDFIARVAKAGGDGIIVQDLAVAALTKEICPALSLHGSTQMAVHNLAGAKALEAMGFTRVVLARELTLSEIAYIAQNTFLELEVFVHGALCMCTSGNCRLSAMLGGRSGNRGLCAQPCRLDFQNKYRHYALSLKDMSHLPYVPDLIKAGVTSFKIEGRMKRPEYAAATVTALADAMAGKETDRGILQAVFSRNGFTDEYLIGKRTSYMFGHRTKEDTKDTDTVLPILSALYRKERQQVPVDMVLTARLGQPATLQLTAEDCTVTVNGPVAETAEKRPLTYDFAKKSLFKCGGTPYLPGGLDLHCDENILLPLAGLKEMRRAGLEQLTALRLEQKKRPIGAVPSITIPPYTAGNMAYHYMAQRFDQVVLPNRFERIILPAEEILAHPEKAERYGEKLFALLPILQYSHHQMEATLQQLKNMGFTQVMAQNIGAAHLALQNGFTVAGGAGLNITNTLALKEWQKLGLCDGVLSPELSAKELEQLGGNLPRGAYVYGHLPAMEMRACPLKKGDKCGDCPGGGSLTDRKGVTWQVDCHNRQFTTLYNPIALYMGNKPLQNIDFGVLYMTKESPKECEKRVRFLLNGEKADFPCTAGMYGNGVF